MREFNVRIKEILVKTVTVEAENPTHAKKIAEKHWMDGDYNIDADCFDDVTFTVPPRKKQELKCPMKHDPLEKNSF
ncbi:MAG: DpnD/PcfM family protein [Clostridiales bacterium]|jgi:hypothetical protein|nr:DpnD/PcfM family protein [Clostridiales bacterium]